MYYSDKLNKLKCYMKQTWSVINSIIGRSRKKTVFCDYLIKDNVKVYDKQDIANDFNKFYINVGPGLAKNINDPKKVFNLMILLNILI